MRRAARIDANQPSIVKAMRQLGAVVTLLHRVGGGVADLLVSWRLQWFVMECKAKSRDDLTPDQIEWIGEQRAAVVIVTTPDEAVRFLLATKP